VPTSGKIWGLGGTGQGSGEVKEIRDARCEVRSAPLPLRGYDRARPEQLGGLCGDTRINTPGVFKGCGIRRGREKGQLFWGEIVLEVIGVGR